MKKTETKEEVVLSTTEGSDKTVSVKKGEESSTGTPEKDETVVSTGEKVTVPEVVEKEFPNMMHNGVDAKIIIIPDCPTCLGKGRVDITGNPSTMSCEDCEGTGVKK